MEPNAFSGGTRDPRLDGWRALHDESHHPIRPPSRGAAPPSVLDLYGELYVSVCALSRVSEGARWIVSTLFRDAQGGMR
jgi:hypothetical protein